MLYLDNAATGGTKPPSVQNAVRAAMQCCANPGRSGHSLSLACAERTLACRTLLCELFDGASFERVCFTKNCTEALNFAIFGVLSEGDHVVTTCLEHNSVLRPLHHLARIGKITYSIAPLENGTVQPQTVASLVQKNTKLVAVTSASNVTGVTPDLAAIRAALPPHVLFLVDGAQGAGHIPISMNDTGIDLLALAGHKGLNAIQGASALLFSERVNPSPTLYGGTGSESFNADMPDFYPDRLESGTVSYPAICSLFEGALIAKTGVKSGGELLVRMTDSLIEQLKLLPRYEVFSTPNACGIVAFRHKKYPSEEVAQTLSDDFSVAVRGGLHCAPLAHKALGTFPDGLIRASFSPWQGMREVQELISVLRRI